MILIIIAILIFIYLITNCSMKYDSIICGGDNTNYNFSPLFEELDPSINIEDLVYYDNNLPASKNLTKKLIDIYFKFNPQLEKIDNKNYNILLRIYNNNEIVFRSADSVEDIISLNLMMGAVGFLYSEDHNLGRFHPVTYYLNDIINNINYEKTSLETRLKLQKQLKNIILSKYQATIRSELSYRIGRYIINLSSPKIINTSGNILEGFRSEFYNIYKSNDTIYKDKNIKKKAYKRLLDEAPTIYNNMKSLNMTDEQDRMYHTLIKRIENLIKN